jgi:hypothetical protein
MLKDLKTLQAVQALFDPDTDSISDLHMMICDAKVHAS